MRNFKHFISIVTLILILIIFDQILNFLTNPNTWADSFNKDVNKLINEGEQVDLIAVGASRTLYTLDPEVLEKELGFDNVLNAASLQQPISGSYYELKYLLEEFSPKYVILGVTWDQLLDSNDYIQAKLLLADKLPLKYKLEYVKDSFTSEEYPLLLNSYRYRNNLDLNIIKQTISDKINPSDKASEYYDYKGFIFSKNYLENGNTEFIDFIGYDESNIDPEKYDYLNKIVALCKNNNIKLYLFTGPTTLMTISRVENYNGAVIFFENFARENDLIYDNLDLLKGRVDFLPDLYMKDSNHVNGKGAKITSRIYSQILKANFNGEDTSGYFYESVSDLMDDVHRVVAVRGKFTETIPKNLNVIVESVQNKDTLPEYQILISDNGSSYKILFDYSVESSYNIDVSKYSEDYSIRINARLKGSESTYEAYQIY